MLPDMGNTVYDIRASGQNWAGVGDEMTRKPRMGFLPANAPKEWLSIVLHVSSTVNPADIPPEGLSVYENGQTRIGEEGAWHLVRCSPAGGIRIVELSTQPPPRP
jgi:hypothetical protein